MADDQANDKVQRIVAVQLYHDALRQARLAVRYADDTEDDRPATPLEEAIFAHSATAASEDAKDAARFRFRHSSYIDAEGYEYGYCKVRWKNGKVDSMLWARDEEIDAAMARERLREKIKADPDLPCEAGPLHPDGGDDQSPYVGDKS